MVSPRKSISALSVTSERHDALTSNRRTSCESLCSATSSRSSANILYRCKFSGSRAKTVSGMRQPSVAQASSEVRQRVLSARRLRIKTYQNQLTEAHNKISELSAELRLLSTLHKRQDNALAKYESSNAELPQLLHAHAEELRMWQSKYRTLQSAHKELESKLKQKEATILSLSDQNKILSQLNRDKGLEERQRLADKLAAMETRLQEKDNDMKLLARKMQLEIRNYKQQLINEQKRTREAQQKVDKLRFELLGLGKLDEMDSNGRMPSMKTVNADVGLENVRKVMAPNEFSRSVLIGSSSNASSPHNSARVKTAERRKSEDSEVLGDLPEPLTAANSNSHSDTNESTTRTIKSVYTNALIEFEQTTQFKVESDSGEQVGAANSDAVEKSNLEENAEIPGNSELNRLSFPYKGDELSDASGQKGEGQSESVSKSEADADDSNNRKQHDRQTFEKCIDETQQKFSTACRDLLSIFASASSKIDERKGCSAASRRASVCKEMDPSSRTPASPKAVQHRFKQDISSLRKQISEDYKEREAFLDTFCRQATGNVLPDGTASPKCSDIPNGDSSNSSAESNRRNRLLAALKAIDGNAKSNRRN